METKKTTIWVVLAALLAIIIVGVLVVRGQNKEVVENKDQQEVENYEKTIDIKHQYKDGKHLFAGTLEVPSPCYQVELTFATGEVTELNFITRDSGGVCAQVVTDANFYGELEAPENQLFIGKLNGEPVNLNTFEIDADLDINEIDIFMKG